MNKKTKTSNLTIRKIKKTCKLPWFKKL